jgi:hypothetical protein
MSLNEKIALLSKVGILKSDGNEAEINSALVDYFAAGDKPSYEFLLGQSTPEEDMIAAAIDYVSKEIEQTGSSGISLSADPYSTANAGQSGGTIGG